jgi:hypothetical protein
MPFTHIFYLSPSTRLCFVAHEMGITSITISQRLALEEFHNNELRMGNANGDEGWRLHAIGSEGPSALNSSLLNTSASD